MARTNYGKQFGKAFAAIVLLILTFIGLSYGSLLRRMDRAAEEYGRGDVEAALSQYESIEGRLRSLGALRLIPAKDRGNLILNQARLLYALGRYEDVLVAMDRESEIVGVSNNDCRFLLLNGDVAFRRAISNYRESAQQDPGLLDDALRTAETYLRDSLRLCPDDWDAKYNFEFMRLNRARPAQIPLLMMGGENQDPPPTTLPAELSP
jgi:tetratricopeptide (TPR) repeat protein